MRNPARRQDRHHDRLPTPLAEIPAAQSFGHAGNCGGTLVANRLRRACRPQAAEIIVVDRDAARPIKCPVAPLEFCFLADDYFRRRGIRDRVQLSYVTPLDGAFTKPVASRQLGGLLAAKSIELVTEFSTGTVQSAGEGGRLVSYDEREVPFDLAVIVLLLAMVFRFLPDAEIKWRDVWIGASLTALLFYGGKFVLGIYLGSGAAGSAYGAASSMITMLLWVFYSAQIVLFGAEFTQVYANAYGSHVRPSPDAVKVKREEVEVDDRKTSSDAAPQTNKRQTR